jgi:hypothetical protein
MWRTKRLEGSLRKVIPRIMKVYSLKKTAEVYTMVMVLHGRNPTSYTPQRTTMSPTQLKCHLSNVIQPAAAEQYHLWHSYVGPSLSYMTKAENWKLCFDAIKWRVFWNNSQLTCSFHLILMLSQLSNMSLSQPLQLSCGLSIWLLINKTVKMAENNITIFTSSLITISVDWTKMTCNNVNSFSFGSDHPITGHSALINERKWALRGQS